MQETNLKTQAEAVIYFLGRMDIDMINDILDNDRTYQDFEKHVFIRKLGYVFNEFIKSGDSFLNCHSGFCNSEFCNYKCTGFSFTGNYSKKYMDLIIEIEKGIVLDIYECIAFKNLDSGIKKYRQIKINKHEF